MKKKLLIIFSIVIVCFALATYYQFSKTINLNEELPIQISPENIVWGKIMAFHPDLFYKKYRLNFALNNPMLTEEVLVEPDKGIKIKEFYYYINNIEQITKLEKMILLKDSAQTYLKYLGSDGNYYIFTVSGDHGGSANYRTLNVRLYEDKHYELVFNRQETYSVDPGIDSNFFSERIKLFVYKTFSKDDRY